ncbi:MAG: hypothetical protein KGD70_03980 [Candidatus Lokiarchaeota archaeon]|jgi:hypothetical protein|nr:hypothetical protein [Candidatus Lokiarchaeota archaeon]
MILCAGDYENMLKDGLIQKLNWLEEEFSFLFNSKKHNYSQKDRDLANQIIKNISDSINSSEDVRLKELLIDTLKSIKDIYPELF